MATPYISMAGIGKSFGPVHALKSVNLTVYPGEIHALLGENGAGKSTLMKVLSGIHEPTKGTITINNISYNKLDSALCLTEKVLMESDLHIYELEEQNRDVEDEELLYETELQKSLNSELRWIYIYLLVKTERNNEARSQIEIYLANKKYCEHEKEASALFEEIKKK